MQHVACQVLLCLACSEWNNVLAWLPRFFVIFYGKFKYGKFKIHEAHPVCHGECVSIISVVIFIWKNSQYLSARTLLLSRPFFINHCFLGPPFLLSISLKIACPSRTIYIPICVITGTFSFASCAS